MAHPDCDVGLTAPADAVAMQNTIEFGIAISGDKEVDVSMIAAR
jgi:hypothetical protein